jgi:ribosomal protein L37AE/L43A
MKVAVTSTVLFDVPEQPVDQVARAFRRANEIAIGVPMRTVFGQVYTMRAIEQLIVVEVPVRPRSFTCPSCGRTSDHPTDVAQRYCAACHRFLDS